MDGANRTDAMSSASTKAGMRSNVVSEMSPLNRLRTELQRYDHIISLLPLLTPHLGSLRIERRQAAQRRRRLQVQGQIPQDHQICDRAVRCTGLATANSMGRVRYSEGGLRANAGGWRAGELGS